MNLKYYLLTAAAALSLGACSTDNTGTERGPNPQKEGYKISFTVADDPESRTTLDAKDILRWVFTDKVGIYTVGQNTNRNAKTIADVNQRPVEFIGILDEYASKGDIFYAYYPYDPTQSDDPEAVNLSIPAAQTQAAADVYNGQWNPLVAVPLEIEWEQNSYAGRISSVRFRHLGAIVELQLYSLDETLRGEKIRSVSFESDAPLAGDFSFNLTTVTEAEDLPIGGYQSTVATTELDEPATVPATKDGAARVYLTIAPGQYKGKFVVETDAALYTFRLANAMDFRRAVIKGLPSDLAMAERGMLPDAFIPFIDDEVKRICVTNWDTNGDEKLSYEEAEAVKDLGQIFKKNTSIASFYELRYFTGLQSIGSSAFDGCSNLTSITIPDGVTAIGASAFYGCSKLTSINIPNQVKAIESATFFGCSNLTSITIPRGVATIGFGAFGNCSHLTSVYCKPTTPPYLDDYAFDATQSNMDIYVPAGSVETYKEAEGWRNFASKITADND